MFIVQYNWLTHDLFLPPTGEDADLAELFREVSLGETDGSHAIPMEEAPSTAPPPAPSAPAIVLGARIWRVDEVIDHRQVKARGKLQEVETPWGRLRFATNGFTMAHGDARIDRPAPALSAHTDEVLAAAGFGAAEIAALRENGVI